MSTSKVIYITGFGVFNGHEEKNASWEAVKLIPDQLALQNDVYVVRKLEIPVVYDAVNDTVTKIWAENPLLVIHVGVDAKISKITLEKCSKTTGYCKIDYAGNCLPEDKIKLINCGCEDVLHSAIDVDKIVATLNRKEQGDRFAVSCDVGNYLCGYIYAKSLDVTKNRTLFIHVPKINCPFPSSEVKDAILDVVALCLEML